jgi:hypothetical protein
MDLKYGYYFFSKIFSLVFWFSLANPRRLWLSPLFCHCQKNSILCERAGTTITTIARAWRMLGCEKQSNPQEGLLGRMRLSPAAAG